MTKAADYLAHCTWIDWQAPAVQARAGRLARHRADDESIARACFEFVRDEIQHSWDFQRNPVTCKASDVLEQGTGYCYAKSHLLAALLRANGIPAALCYQRLTIDDGRPPFCLHGLNAVFLQKHGWYRLDARGNKPGVDAAFMPPRERLAFTPRIPGEGDLPGLYAQPLPEVVTVLENSATWQEVAAKLPDRQP